MENTIQKIHKTRPPAKRATRPVVYAISDSTGSLVRHLLSALSTQFPPGAIQLQFEQFVRTESHLQQILARADSDASVVCHAVVSKDFKALIARSCAKAKIPCLDLTGNVLDFLARETGIPPRDDIEALHRVDHSYKQRISALEFTLSHDDGLGLATIHEADLVITGVSRTSKTPTSIYLAQQGYRVANVSLAMGIDPPRELLALPAGKVIGFVIRPAQLVLIRARRQTDLGSGSTNYADLDYVTSEVRWAQHVFQQHQWPALDITDQAIEETAARILATLRISNPALNHSDELA